MAPSLLILYTGGTLGMVKGRHGLEPGGDLDSRLRTGLAALPLSRQAALPDWQLETVGLPIDSSSATPAEWLTLAAYIRRRVSEQPQRGIVILHGTDTMAWCAALLSVLLEEITAQCPIVVTGAQRPLEAAGSDASHNVELALRYAAHPQSRGLMLAFGDQLLAGDAARKWYTDHYQGFIAPNAQPLAVWPVAQRNDTALPAPLPCAHTDARLRVAAHLNRLSAQLNPAQMPHVVRIVLWPGIQAAQLKALLAHADAALLETWGSGNLPHDRSLHQTLKQATHAGMPIIALSQCPYGSTHIGTYAAGEALKKAGVIEGETLTPELAFALLFCAARDTSHQPTALPTAP